MYCYGDKMRRKLLKPIGLLLAGILIQMISHAQEFGQSPEELQRIRDYRLLELYAKEQAKINASRQNTSSDQPYQKANTQVAAPESEELFTAATDGNTNQIGQLLSQGLNINVSNNEGETALHMAAARGHYSTLIYLINQGADVNARTVKNWIPLHHAVRFRHPNIVNYLIKKGAATHAKTTDGLSAIDMANNLKDYRLLSILGARK